MKYNFDPELAGSIEFLPKLSFADPVAAREEMETILVEFGGQVDDAGTVIENRTIPGPAGDAGPAVRIYTPEGMNQTSAGLLYIHGGGFAIGDLDSEEAAAVMICRELQVVVVSVDYRLAPEHPYPAGLEDCYAALQWMHSQAGALQVDRQRIGVRGGSAGGGLAAALALLARDRGGPALCFQYLGIPELDDRLQTVSMTEFTDTPLWHRPNAVLSWKYYLGDRYGPGGDEVPIYAAPARASVAELRGLPPAYLTTMEFDPLRDEGIEYALKLLQAGVAVELHNFPGAFHGSELLAEAEVSKRGSDEGLEALRRGLKLDR